MMIIFPHSYSKHSVDVEYLLLVYSKMLIKKSRYFIKKNHDNL